MSFIPLTYEYLQKQALLNKSYRGSHNRYPVGKRTQSSKYFLVEEENNTEVFRVFYGVKTIYSRIDEQTFLRGPTNSNMSYFRSGDDRFMSVETRANDVLLVRPDNTIEFTAYNLTGGDIMILNKWSYGRYYQSGRQGGVVYVGRENYEDKGAFHPIWKGARFDAVTMKPYKPYQVFGLTVNRKLAKDFFKSYEKFFITSKAMVSAMDWDSFRTLAKDVVNEYTPHIDWQQVAASPYYMGSESLKTFLPIADSIRDSAPLDAYILYLCFYNFRAIYAAARNPVGYAEKYDFEQQWTRFKRHYTQHIYEKSSHLFKEVEYTAGKRYAPNHWGIKVTVDGQQVKQY